MRCRPRRLGASYRLPQGPFIVLLEVVDSPQDLACLVIENRYVLVRGGYCFVGLVKQLLQGLHP
jgi:hypothetical protein